MHPIDTVLEKHRPSTWIALGVGAAVLFAGSTLFLGAAGDLVAGGAALCSGLAGLGAAGRRHRLETLPLVIAPVALRSRQLQGWEVTVRGCLGRGRRVDRLEVEACADGVSVEPLFVPGPLVGPFQVVIPGRPRELQVRFRVYEGDRIHEQDALFGEGAIQDGRFPAPLRREGDRWVLALERWERKA